MKHPLQAVCNELEKKSAELDAKKLDLASSVIDGFLLLITKKHLTDSPDTLRIAEFLRDHKWQ